MKLLPIIDDTPKPYDHPKQLWWYRVTHYRKPGAWFVWARSSGAARYAVSKQHHGVTNAIYYTGGYRARREP